MFVTLQSEARMIVQEIGRLAYFMKGGITYDSLLLTSHAERQIFRDIVEEALKFEIDLRKNSLM